MDLNSLLYTFGLSGLFSSRAFLPAFITSLALKYGDSFPILKSFDLIQMASSEPTWFTHGGVVTALGVLAAIELIADKSPDARAMLDEVSVYLKTGVSALTTMGVLSSTDKEFTEQIVYSAGFFDLFPAIASGVITFFVATMRKGVLGILSDADEDDDLGIRSLISWWEEIWATFGVWLLLWYAVGMVVLIGLFAGLLVLIQKRHEKKQDEAKIKCGGCSERIHPFATQCYHCGEAVSSPQKLGFLGRLSNEGNPDINSQRLRLLELKRSPKSGEKFEDRGVDAVCEADSVKAFGDKELTREYLDMVTGRLPQVLIIGGVFSLLPILGLIVGVIYYRFKLVAPFRRYLPLSQGIFVKWMIRLFFLVLIAFQWLPVANGLVVPIMALVNYLFYRSAFKKALGKSGLMPD